MAGTVIIYASTVIKQIDKTHKTFERTKKTAFGTVVSKSDLSTAYHHHLNKQ